jgi:hypothetical protein
MSNFLKLPQELVHHSFLMVLSRALLQLTFCLVNAFAHVLSDVVQASMVQVFDGDSQVLESLLRCDFRRVRSMTFVVFRRAMPRMLVFLFRQEVFCAFQELPGFAFEDFGLPSMSVFRQFSNFSQHAMSAFTQLIRFVLASVMRMLMFPFRQEVFCAFQEFPGFAFDGFGLLTVPAFGQFGSFSQHGVCTFTQFMMLAFPGAVSIHAFQVALNLFCTFHEVSGLAFESFGFFAMSAFSQFSDFPQHGVGTFTQLIQFTFGSVLCLTAFSLRLNVLCTLDEHSGLAFERGCFFAATIVGKLSSFSQHGMGTLTQFVCFVGRSNRGSGNDHACDQKAGEQSHGSVSF